MTEMVILNAKKLKKIIRDHPEDFPEIVPVQFKRPDIRMNITKDDVARTKAFIKGLTYGDLYERYPEFQSRFKHNEDLAFFFKCRELKEVIKNRGEEVFDIDLLPPDASWRDVYRELLAQFDGRKRVFAEMEFRPAASDFAKAVLDDVRSFKK